MHTELKSIISIEYAKPATIHHYHIIIIIFGKTELPRRRARIVMSCSIHSKRSLKIDSVYGEKNNNQQQTNGPTI